MRWAGLLVAGVVAGGCQANPIHDELLCDSPVGSAVEPLSSISCDERVDTGYVRGDPYPIVVVTVDGKPVERDTANAYFVMAAAAAAAGVEIRIVSGFRTMAEQEHLYYCYTACACNGCNLAARPGYSNHQSGHALDLNTSSGGVYGWLAANGPAFGFNRTVPSEPWHWEWWGGGPGGGPCRQDLDRDGSPAGIDCDDGDPLRFPGRWEDCDGRENDCDGGIDEGLVRVCGTDVGECVAGTETCAAGAWGACAGAVWPAPETCDQLDNDCDAASDEDQVCEREEAMLAPAIHGATLSSDVDGDGRADACARTAAGFSCLLGSGHGFGHAVTGPELDDDDGWSEPMRAWSLRMADIDGDGRSDVCGRQSDRLTCWRSTGTGFGAAVIGPALGEGVTSFDLADVNGDAKLDACVRDAEGLRCHLASGHGFDRTLLLAALGDAAGFADVVHHGTLRIGDLDGDGRADVCARGADGVECWRSLGDRFGDRVLGPRWSDDGGWRELSSWSTLRMIDADGDGRADLCARTPEGFRCELSEGDRFGATLVGPPLPVVDGWDRPAVYTTLRMGDLDGDGRADLCAREADRVRCWLGGPHGFDRLVLGPELSDAAGWDRAPWYRSIRLADVDADGRADLCARDATGLRCHEGGEGFGHVWIVPAWSDASGLGDPAWQATIRIAGGGAPTAMLGPAAEKDDALFGNCAVTPGRDGGSWLAWVLASGLALTRRRRKRRY